MDERGDLSNDEAPKVIKPTSKEFRKTWGFRRTTIAKREGAGDMESDCAERPQQQQSPSLRRSGRQPKRTERVEEFLTRVRRRGRRSVPMSLEDSGEPASCPATDAETASEGSVDSTPETRSGSKAGSTAVKERPASSGKARACGDEDDTSGSDSDGLTLKELQNRLRRKREREPATRPLRGKRRAEDPAGAMAVDTGDSVESTPSGEQAPAADLAAPGDRDSELGGRATQGVRGEGSGGSARHKPESEVYDPNALYCICRQPHNNRFMICCDRCEEWFHGDCVGISEARGRLLERNGEDYICPNCTILQVQDEPASESAEQQDANLRPSDADGTDCTSIGTVEQKCSEDQGIKGRIEKAANPSGKKKLKIFQPVAEAPGAAKCIGPGCSSVAQPDSVYCSNDCILKHAAATMKFLSSGKEPKAKPKDKIKAKPERPILPKCSVQAGVKISSVHKRPAPDKKENAVKKAVVVPARSEVLVKEATCESTPSWASDHNYNAVKPQQTAAVWPTLLYKSVKDDRHVEQSPAVASLVPKRVAPPGPGPTVGGKQLLPRSILPKKPPFTNVAVAKPIMKVPSGFKGAIPKRPWLSASAAGGAPAAKQAGLVPGAATSASRKLPGSATLVGATRKPAATSVPLTSPALGRLGTSGAAPSQPNSQIRQNIRRSLKEILWKRVSDSDDLIMTESEVGKIALHIEKEMFSLFRVTDNRYKSKYRSLMFNLKDPKNQGLFHRVLREEISLAKLVRMKPEELVSKELSVWKERPTKPVMESRAKLHSEGKRVAIQQEVLPGMEDSPPVSDSDEQESVRAAPEHSAAPLLDVFSGMLRDTTSQHRAHLFDLNCRICTGQVPSSEDEPAPKRQKVSTSVKKEQPRPKHEDACAPEPVLSPANGATPEPLPENAPEPDPESLAHAHSERQGHPEPSALEGPSCPAPSGGGVLTTVTMSGRDPRTAQTGPSTVTTPAAAPSDGTQLAGPRQDAPKPSVASVLVPKSILAKPSSSPEPRYLPSVSPSVSTRCGYTHAITVCVLMMHKTGSGGVTELRPPPEEDTALFLSRLSTIWKGFINMQSVAKFVTKAYPVSGCFDYLSEDLPDTIHIGGRIAPRTVWDYVGKLKSSVSKELCLIRFHPATEEEEVAYISLYSYFSSRGRFGVVSNNSKHVKDLYLIPLSADDPVPPKLLPFEGPGLESSRPNIILGLVICQKIKRPSAGELDKMEEKRARVQAQEEVDVSFYPKTPPASQPEKKPPKYPLGTGDTAVGTPPPGSPPPPPPLPEPPAAPASSPSVSKALSSQPAAASSSAAPTAAATAAAAAASKTASPLEHILQTLFGKKKSFDPPAKEPVESAPASHQDAKAQAGCGRPAAPLLDPIVQQFGQLSRERALEEEGDDRPYDPEEEYGPDRAAEGKRPEADRAPEGTEREEVAYDPEDETILEEAKVTVDDLPNRMCADAQGGSSERPAGYVADTAAPSLVEQQKMIEELNLQIEEQKRQVQEQEEALRQQRAAVGASMAHFSVSDALMSPPPKSSLPKPELFPQEQPAAARPAAPGPACDPRQSRDPRQARRLAESSETNGSKAPATCAPSAPPAREAPAGAGVPEEKESWAPGAEATQPARQDGAPSERPESLAQPAPESGPPTAGGVGPARPARKVLLPTPPGTAFPPSFPLQNASQNFSAAGRDLFPSAALTPQEKSFGSSQYEDPRNAVFAENCDHSAAETEGDRDPQARAGEGAAPFPPPGHKGGPPPQFQGQREPAPRAFGMSGLHGPNFPGPRGPVPAFSEDNVSNSDGLRGPPPPRFGAQKGPIRSLFSGPHGPPPYGECRGPAPPHPGGPRGLAPHPFEELKDPHGDKREFQDGPHDMAGAPAQFQGPEQPPFMGSRGVAPFQFGGPRRPLLSQFKGPRGGPPPQFGGQRGPPPGHFGGPRGPHPNQFEGPRGQAPGFLQGPRGMPPQQFEEPRPSAQPPRFANQRAPGPLPFGGPRGPAPFPEKSEPGPPRFHFQGQPAPGPKPVPRPLLELPSHPPHRKDRWDEGGAAPGAPGAQGAQGAQGPGADPEAPWAPADFREGPGPEHRAPALEARPRERFEAGPKEKPPDEPDAQPEGRQGRAFDERRREREHGKPWERGRAWAREREWDRRRDWDKSKERAGARERSRERSRNRDRRRDRDRSRSRERDKARERGRDRKDRSRSRERARDPKAAAPAGAT